MVEDSGGHLSWGRGRREITSVSSQVPPCLYSSMNLDTGNICNAVKIFESSKIIFAGPDEVAGVRDGPPAGGHPARGPELVQGRGGGEEGGEAEPADAEVGVAGLE